jgi:MFS superfamily sulfate permease-like transporter
MEQERAAAEHDEAARPADAPWKRWRLGPNRWSASEVAGAFGDLGTLVPFVVGYLAVLRLDPTGVLLGFGASLILAGAYYRTPVPVQPMKAIGATAIAGGTGVGAGMIGVATLLTGAIWLFLGLTGAVRRITALVAPPVVRGIVLGLGLTFLIGGVRDIVAQPLAGSLALVLTFVLVAGRIPVMFLLLLFGVAVGLAVDPDLLDELSRTAPSLTLPDVGLGAMTWGDVVPALTLLVLPQLPLTVGSAVIAVTAEHNRVLPERPVSERMIATTTGVMNALGAFVGGVPMCHGAGGLAGHVRFGARSGTATILLGALLLVLGLLFRDSVDTIFRLFPRGVLGVLVCFAGLELATASRDLGTKEEATTTLLTAGFAAFHMGLALLAGVALHFAFRRRWAKLGQP